MVNTKDLFDFSVQACMNTYYGKHGALDFSKYDDGEVMYMPYDSTWCSLNPNMKVIVYDNKESGLDFVYGIVNGVPGINKRAMVIAFQGSTNDENNIDWKDDFDFWAHKLDIPYALKTKIRIHGGIYKQYLSGRDLIRKIIRYAIDKGLDILFTGHSLGGGLTYFGYSDANYMMNDELKISTDTLWGVACAAPRVGNQAYADSLAKRSKGQFWLIWVNGDIVHDAPPKIFGFADSGILIPFGKKRVLYGVNRLINHSPYLLKELINGRTPSDAEVLKVEGIIK